MTIPFTAEQDELYDIFEPYTVYNKESGPGLSNNAPMEAVEAYKKWRQLCKEQREREIALMFD